MRTKFSSMWRVATALVLALGLSLVMVAPASAAITAGPTYTGEITSGQTIVASSAAWTPVMRVAITSDGVVDSVQSVRVLFTSVSGFTNSDLLGSGDNTGLTLFRSADNTFGGDTEWAPNSISWSGLDATMVFTTDRTLTAAAQWLFVAIKTSATISQGDAFTVTMGTNYLTVEGLLQTATQVTSNTLTADTVKPTISTIAGTTVQGDNDTIAITFSEAINALADNAAYRAALTLVRSPDSASNTVAALTNATFVLSGGGTILTMTINEATDLAYLVNGNVIAITPVVNAFTDIAGNGILATKIVGTTANSGDNVAPGIPVNQITGTTVQADRDTVAITFSEKVRPADGTWSSNEFASLQSPDGTSISLTGATYAVDAAAPNTTRVTIQLSDAAADAAFLKNGNQVAVTPAANAIVDLAGNANPTTEIVSTTLVVGESDTPDLLAGDGNTEFVTDTSMILTFDEALVSVDASKISSTSFTVVSASISSTNSAVVNVTISGLSAGNQAAGLGAGATGLQLAAGAVVDRAGWSSEALTNQAVNSDDDAPSILSATVNYGTGVVTITANEKLDASLTTVGNIYLAQTAATGDGNTPNSVVSLSGAAITDVDGTTISITMNEADRAAALVMSGVPGGDGAAVVMNLAADAFRDMANNGNSADDDGNAVTETAETVAPALATGNATLDFDIGGGSVGTAQLVITFVETIDTTPASNVDVSKIWISNTAGSHDVQLTGATVTAADATTVTINLTPAQKAAALAISAQTAAGGDGTAVVVDLDAGAVKDLSGNFNVASQGKAVTETADNDNPTYTDGNAKLTSATNIDVTFNEPLKASTVTANGSQFTSVTGAWTATAAALDGTDKRKVHVTVSGISGNELRGIANDLNIAGTLQDLTGNAYAGGTSQDIDDGIAPTFTIAYYTESTLTTSFTGDYMNGGTTYYLKITASEELAAAPTISIAAEGTVNDRTDAAMTATITGQTVYRYNRVTADDAAALGATAEVITITGTDAPQQGTANVSTNAAVDGEKKIDGAVSLASLTSPINGESISDSTPALTWGAVTDNNGPVTYTIQLDNDSGFAVPLIVNQAGLTSPTYTVAGTLANGTYYWKVITTDAFGNTSDSGTSQFVISTDTTAPTVTVSSPNGGESLTVDTATTITWTATDNVAVATNGISISLSTDGGAIWTSIVSNTDNDGAYSWTPAAAATSALIKVTAVDTSSNSASDTSNAVFSITTVGTPTTTINLGTGWNLVSLPLVPTNTAIGTVLSGISANVQAVWYYDTSVSPAAWKSWAPGLPPSPTLLTTFTDGKAYWLNMTAPSTLISTGTAFPAPPALPSAYNVAVGWNMIGFTSTTAKLDTTYLAGLTGIVRLYRYDNITGYAVVVSGTNMNPGEGFWLSVTTAGTIYP